MLLAGFVGVSRVAEAKNHPATCMPGLGCLGQRCLDARKKTWP